MEKVRCIGDTRGCSTMAEIMTSMKNRKEVKTCFEIYSGLGKVHVFSLSFGFKSLSGSTILH